MYMHRAGRIPVWTEPWMTLMSDDDQDLSMSPAAIYLNEDFLQALTLSDKVVFYHRARHHSHLGGP